MSRREKRAAARLAAVQALYEMEMSGKGVHDAMAEFEAHFHTVVDDYIAACQALGSEPERPASGRLMLRVSPEVHAASLKAAALSGTSLNRWAEQALKAATRRSTKTMPGASKATRLSKKVAGTTQAAR